MTDAVEKCFNLTVTLDVALTIAEIWPDGDAPPNPTVDDVLKVIAASGGKHKILHDWDLDNDLDMEVSDETASKDVP